jgi:hypothetical protein
MVHSIIGLKKEIRELRMTSFGEYRDLVPGVKQIVSIPLWIRYSVALIVAPARNKDKKYTGTAQGNSNNKLSLMVCIR